MKEKEETRNTNTPGFYDLWKKQELAQQKPMERGRDAGRGGAGHRVAAVGNRDAETLGQLTSLVD